MTSTASGDHPSRPAERRSVGVVFITHCARHHLPNCLPPVFASTLAPRVLVVNSSSNDGTVELARDLGAEVLVIPRAEFNHGATRERARRHIGTDIVVMMTPDAYAEDPGFLEALVRPLLDGVAAVSYARQIPHRGAGPLETFSRVFNYPAHSELRGRDDLERYGSYTFFCSDSCAAWSNRALDEIGGFLPTLTAEDAHAVARLIARGEKVAYVAEAVVRHSHGYTTRQEFQRFFDTGYYRRLMVDMMAGYGDEGRGKAFFRALMGYLWTEKPSLIPYACWQTAAKLAGYRIGWHAHRLPLWMIRRLSAQDYYWSSVFGPGSDGPAVAALDGGAAQDRTGAASGPGVQQGDERQRAA